MIEHASPYRLLYINQFLYLLLGYGTMAELQEESESASIHSFIHPEDLEKAKEALHSMTDIGFAHCVLRVQKKNAGYVQLDLFTDYAALEKKKQQESAELEREKKMQQAMLKIKKKFGKNAILKGMNLEEGATAKDRNAQIGGHKA